MNQGLTKKRKAPKQHATTTNQIKTHISKDYLKLVGQHTEQKQAHNMKRETSANN